MSGESEAMVMDLHPDTLSAHTLLKYIFLVLFFFFLFPEKADFLDLDNMCSSHGSWSCSTRC